jgi:hypothetical protein
MLLRACLSLVLAASFVVACGATGVGGGSAEAQEFVSGHYRHNHYGGLSYVQPHYRTHADGNFYNNWSTYPNANPYTGTIGTHHRPTAGYGYSYGAGLGGFGWNTTYRTSFWGW